MDLGPEACLLIQVTKADITQMDGSLNLNMEFRDPDSWWGIIPLRWDSPFYAPEGSTLADKEFDGAFANSGTHQVPLFKGIPLDEIIRSDTPLATLIEKLKASEPGDSVGCDCSWNWFPWSKSLSTSVGSDELILCPSGASAIVRIHDAKMRQFANDHIKVNGSIIPWRVTLDQIIGAQVGASVRSRLYDWNPLKHEAEPRLKDCRLRGFREHFQTICDNMNSKLRHELQEYIDSLP
jgi:hypothetical protein